MAIYAFATPPKPRYFWRVTDSTSITQQSPTSGDFDTGTALWGHWSYWTSNINVRNLNKQVDWGYRFTAADGYDPPLFVSVTDDCAWAYDEFNRRWHRNRKNIKIHVMDTESMEWACAFLENGVRMPVLRDSETGCTFFSTEAATKALGWENPCKSSKEWFAIKWIPETLIQPTVFAGG